MTMIATAMPRPNGMVPATIRSLQRPPVVKARIVPATGTTIDRTRRNPLTVAASETEAGYAIMLQDHRPRFAACLRAATARRLSRTAGAEAQLPERWRQKQRRCQ